MKYFQMILQLISEMAEVMSFLIYQEKMASSAFTLSNFMHILFNLKVHMLQIHGTNGTQVKCLSYHSLHFSGYLFHEKLLRNGH